MARDIPTPATRLNSGKAGKMNLSSCGTNGQRGERSGQGGACKASTLVFKIQKHHAWSAVGVRERCCTRSINGVGLEGMVGSYATQNTYTSSDVPGVVITAAQAHHQEAVMTWYQIQRDEGLLACGGGTRALNMFHHHVPLEIQNRSNRCVCHGGYK